jgi:translation initiation factor IF-2
MAGGGGSGQGGGGGMMAGAGFGGGQYNPNAAAQFNTSAAPTSAGGKGGQGGFQPGAQQPGAQPPRNPQMLAGMQQAAGGLMSGQRPAQGQSPIGPTGPGFAPGGGFQPGAQNYQTGQGQGRNPQMAAAMQQAASRFAGGQQPGQSPIGPTGQGFAPGGGFKPGAQNYQTGQGAPQGLMGTIGTAKPPPGYKPTANRTRASTARTLNK